MSVSPAEVPTAVPRAEDFADWVRPHLRSMALLAARLAPDADRDDVVQEALTQAWRKRRQFDRPAARRRPGCWRSPPTARDGPGADDGRSPR